jgi:hypothetical protein
VVAPSAPPKTHPASTFVTAVRRCWFQQQAWHAGGVAAVGVVGPAPVVPAEGQPALMVALRHPAGQGGG